jgi:hypothetical protein
LAALLFAGAAAAQQHLSRNFPADALRGELVVVRPPEATIDGRAARLAPGARIRGTNNMVMLPGTIIGARMLVHYTVDSYGLLKDIWVLRDDEAAKPWPRSADEARRWSFDPATQAWAK